MSSEVSEELGARWQSERCPECAFDPNGVSPAELPAAVAGLGRRYQAPLTRFLPGEDASLLVAHPLPDVWSALAYACHVRDVLALFDGRIRRMLSEDDPEFESWDHEAAITAMVNEVIAANPDKAEAYRAGKTALAGFFVGQVVRVSQGKANPQVVQKVVAERLG